MKKILLLIVIAVVAAACAKKTDPFDPVAQAKTDDALIRAYISKNNLTGYALNDTTGLYLKIDTVGNNQHPNPATSSVTINYTGKTLDGTVFDSGTGRTFPLRQLIAAWQLALPKVGEGGVLHIISPSFLAYGNTSVGGLPKNSVLVFDIKLTKVTN